MKKTLAISILSFVLLFNFAFADWLPLTNVPIGIPKDIIYTNNRLFIVSWMSGVSVSMDYGENWSQMNDGIISVLVNSIAFGDGVLLVGTSDEGVFRSTNLGTKWEQSNENLPSKNIAKVIFDGTDFYLLTESSIVMISQDKGKTWNPINLPELDLVVTSISAQNGKLFVGTVNGKIYYTQDKGENWSEISRNYISTSVNYILYDNNELFVATNNGIYYSVNLGVNWDKIESGISEPKINLVAKYNNNLFALTQNTGIYLATMQDKYFIHFNEELPELSLVKIVFDNYYAYVLGEFGSISKRRISEFVFPAPEPPTLLSPPNNATDLDIIINFTWTSSKVIKNYQFLLASSPDFSASSIIVDQNLGKNSSHTITGGLEYQTTYYWKVVATSFDNQIFSSDVFSFTTKASTIPPKLISPPDDATLSTLPIVFSWEKLSGVSEYTFELSESPVFDNPVLQLKTTENELSISDPITDNRTYYWRVGAYFVAFDTTIFSTSRKFSTLTLKVDFTNDPSKFVINYDNLEKKVEVSINTILFEEKITFSIYDIVGRQLHSEQVENNPSSNLIILDLGNIPTGAYILVLKAGNEVFAKRFEVIP